MRTTSSRLGKDPSSAVESLKQKHGEKASPSEATNWLPGRGLATSTGLWLDPWLPAKLRDCGFMKVPRHIWHRVRCGQPREHQQVGGLCEGEDWCGALLAPWSGLRRRRASPRGYGSAPAGLRINNAGINGGRRRFTEVSPETVEAVIRRDLSGIHGGHRLLSSCLCQKGTPRSS